MASRFSELIIDGHDLRRLAEFWCEVLDYKILEQTDEVLEIGAGPVTAEDIRRGPIAPPLVFVTVPDGKSVKNRVHIDVSPIDRSQEDEVNRLLALGATRVDIGQGTVSWVVMADPEGNEFCVLRSLQP